MTIEQIKNKIRKLKNEKLLIKSQTNFDNDADFEKNWNKYKQLSNEIFELKKQMFKLTLNKTI